MSVETLQSQLEDIQTATNNIKTALEEKGETPTGGIQTFAASVSNLGNINTVNGIGADENRNVQLDASKINIDDTAETTQTIKAAIQSVEADLTAKIDTKSSLEYVNDYAKVWFIDTQAMSGELTPESNPEAIAYFQQLTDYLVSADGGIGAKPVTPVIKYGWDAMDYATVSYANWRPTKSGSYDIIVTTPISIKSSHKNTVDGQLYTGVYKGITVSYAKGFTVTGVSAEKEIELDLGYFKFYNEGTEVIFGDKLDYTTTELSSIYASSLVTKFKTYSREVILVLKDNALAGYSDSSLIFYCSPSLELVDNCYTIKSIGYTNVTTETDSKLIRNVLKIHMNDDNSCYSEIIEEEVTMPTKKYIDNKLTDTEIPVIGRSTIPTITITSQGTGYKVGEVVSATYTHPDEYIGDITVHFTITEVSSDTGAVTGVAIHVGSNFAYQYGQSAQNLETKYVSGFSGSGTGLVISLLANTMSATIWGYDGHKKLGGIEIVDKGTNYAVGDFIYVSTVGSSFVAKVTEIDEQGGILAVGLHLSGSKSRYYPITVKHRTFEEAVLTNGQGSGAVVKYVFKTQSASAALVDIYSYLPAESSEMVTLNMHQELEGEVTTLSNTVTEGLGTKADNTRVDTIETNLTTNKQDKLVSGTNIKTLNGETLLGAGNIAIKNIDYIYSWDGQSSSTNPDNIALWQEIINKAKEGTSDILVITHGASSYQHFLFVINEKCLGSKMSTFKSVVSDAGTSYSTNSAKETTGVDYYSDKGQVTIQHDANYVVSNVSDVSENTTRLGGYLPTNNTKITNWTPTYDYHPATKKYVDTKISSELSSIQVPKSIDGTVFGGWHMYSDGENLTEDAGFTSADWDNIVVGNILSYPSSTDSSSSVNTSIIYVSTGYAYKSAGGRYYYRTFKTGSGSSYEISGDLFGTGNIFKGLTIDEGSSGGGGGMACFTANTKVATENGYKSISEIKVGDLVYSYNYKTKEVELKEVDKLVTHDTDEIYNIKVNDEVIETTWSHPFYVVNEKVARGRIQARCLVVGDILLGKDGKLFKVDKVEPINRSEKVYEIRVKDNNCYFVGDTSILVYNEESVLKDE